MSASPYWVVVCDTCAESTPPLPGRLSEVRGTAYEAGWTHRGLGNDTCPDCTDGAA